MYDLTLLQKITIWALPLLFGITLHEVAHGWIANKLGDPTAKMLGRLTINPLKHIDPIGTILVPAILLYLGGFIFGWAKPVPVTWRNLKKPQRDMALVALAGPMANLIMAFLWAAIAKIGVFFGPAANMPARFFVYAGQAGILINLVLMVLNLIPIPPLDGSRVLFSFASPKLSRKLAQFEVYGFFVLVLLLMSGILVHIIRFPVIGLYSLITNLFGL